MSINPTATTVVHGIVIKLVEPLEVAGKIAVRVNAYKCRKITPQEGRCIQFEGHTGSCWDCSLELFNSTQGAWALVYTQ